MHYSGVLIRSRPDRLDQCAEQVAACDGVEVYLRDEGASSLVAVIEGETIACHESRFRAIRDLSAVATAELVYHRTDDGDQPGDDDPPGSGDHADKEPMP